MRGSTAPAGLTASLVITGSDDCGAVAAGLAFSGTTLPGSFVAGTEDTFDTAPVGSVTVSAGAVEGSGVV